MERALSVEHHEFVCGEFFVRDANFDTLILHNERGVFIQVRHKGVPGVHRDFWYPVCRGCGTLLPEGSNYQCTPCMAESLRVLLNLPEQFHGKGLEELMETQDAVNELLEVTKPAALPAAKEDAL